MQIVSYKILKNILTVGFKESNFVVYSQIPYDPTKTKAVLLQSAYEQCKNSVEFEKTQSEHAFISAVTGEEFVPELPKVKTVKLSVDKSLIQFEVNQDSVNVALITEVKDQYGNVLSANPMLTANYGSITGNTLTIPNFAGTKEITVIVSAGGISDTAKITVHGYLEPVVTLLEAQQAKISQINDLYAQKLTSGFTSSATGTPYIYGYGDKDQMKFMQLAIFELKNLLVFPTEIPAKDDTKVLHNESQYNQLILDIGIFAQTQNVVQHMFIDLVNACTTIEQVNAIVVDFG